MDFYVAGILIFHELGAFLKRVRFLIHLFDGVIIFKLNTLVNRNRKMRYVIDAVPVLKLGKLPGLIVYLLAELEVVSSRSDRFLEAVDVLFDFVERGR